MKIDNNILLIAGIGVAAYLLMRKRNGNVAVLPETQQMGQLSGMARVPASRGGWLYTRSTRPPAKRGGHLLSGFVDQGLTQPPPFAVEDLMKVFPAGVAGPRSAARYVAGLPYYGSSVFNTPSRFNPQHFGYTQRVAPTPWNGYDLRVRQKYYVYRDGTL